LDENVASPLYMAVILCVPALNVEAVKTALPPVRVTEPGAFDPSRNCTVPDGDALPARFPVAASTAVILTLWPTVTELALLVKDMDDVGGL
jgi:hypothetical protein